MFRWIRNLLTKKAEIPDIRDSGYIPVHSSREAHFIDITSDDLLSHERSQNRYADYRDILIASILLYAPEMRRAGRRLDLRSTHELETLSRYAHEYHVYTQMQGGKDLDSVDRLRYDPKEGF